MKYAFFPPFLLRLVLLLPLYMSCGKSSEQETAKGNNELDYEEPKPALVLEIKDDDQEISADIFQDVEYIPLESTPESFVGQIDKLRFINNKIFVLDQWMSKNLFVFTSEGKFIKKVITIGEGPNEIVAPYDFDVNPVTNELVILDGGKSKMVFYGADFRPLREKKVPVPIMNFRFLNGETLVSSAGNLFLGKLEGDDLAVMDTSFVIKKRGSKIPKEEQKSEMGLNEYLHSTSNGGVVYTPRFRNKIYSIDEKGEVQLPFELSFKTRGVPEEYNGQSAQKYFDYSKTHSKNFFAGDYFESDEVILMRLSSMAPGKETHIFFNKRNQDYSYGRKKPDASYITLFVRATHKNKFVETLPPFPAEIKKIILKKNDIDPKLREALESNSENPILHLYSIKL